MRLQLMATYFGIPYQVGLGPDGAEATLFSPGPPPEELGFTASAGHWRKQVSVTDLDGLWLSRPVGEYRGEPCMVLDDLGDRLHIAYLGRDAARAAQLGYWEIDREVFEVVVARPDVIGLTEQRVNFPPTAAGVSPSEVRASAPTVPAAAVPAPVAPTAVAPTTTVPTTAVPTTAVPTTVVPAVVAPSIAAGSEAGSGEYRGAAGADVPAGNGRRAANGDLDHRSRRPDRMTAWHGSPEPWRGPAIPAVGPARDRGRDMAADQAARELGGDIAADQAARERRPERWPKPWAEDEPGPEPWTEDEPWSDPWTEREPDAEPETRPRPGRRNGRRDRISPESVFAELLSLAAIPRAAYAVDEEVPGAMCLVEADGGFEVFSRTSDARLEVQFFEDEEAAYFYLFGVLAAEAVRSGRLAPKGPTQVNGHHNGSAPARAVGPPGTTPTSPENVSKYLRGGN
jgi:hypothetical protein